MPLSRRRFLATSGLAIGALRGCAALPNDDPADQPTETPTETPTPTETQPTTETPTGTTTTTLPPFGLDGEITVKGSEWTLDPDAFEANVGWN